MPIPIEALADMLAGQKPRSIDDLMNGLSWIEQASKGDLVDQRVPQTFGKPPLQFRDQGGISGPMFNPTNHEHSFPLVPAGDVVNFPGRRGPFQGPTMDAQEFMPGRLNPNPRTDPKVAPISPSGTFWDDWAQRLRNRKLIDEMGGLRG